MSPGWRSAEEFVQCQSHSHGLKEASRRPNRCIACSASVIAIGMPSKASHRGVQQNSWLLPWCSFSTAAIPLERPYPRRNGSKRSPWLRTAWAGCGERCVIPAAPATATNAAVPLARGCPGGSSARHRSRNESGTDPARKAHPADPAGERCGNPGGAHGPHPAPETPANLA